jgi:hypothetical protein
MMGRERISPIELNSIIALGIRRHWHPHELSFKIVETPTVNEPVAKKRAIDFAYVHTSAGMEWQYRYCRAGEN